MRPEDFSYYRPSYHCRISSLIACLLCTLALLPRPTLSQELQTDSLHIEDSLTGIEPDWGFYFQSVQLYGTGLINDGGTSGISIDIDLLHLYSDSLRTLSLGLNAGGEVVQYNYHWHWAGGQHDNVQSLLARCTVEERPLRLDALLGLSHSNSLSEVGLTLGFEMRVRLIHNFVEALMRISHRPYDDREGFRTVGGLGLVLGWNP